MDSPKVQEICFFFSVKTLAYKTRQLLLKENKTLTMGTWYVLNKARCRPTPEVFVFQVSLLHSAEAPLSQGVA